MVYGIGLNKLSQEARGETHTPPLSLPLYSTAVVQPSGCSNHQGLFFRKDRSDIDHLALLDNAPVKPLISKMHNLLFVAEVKTLERPLTEARLQCQRSGSAIVFSRVQWNEAAEGRTLTQIPAKLPQVGPNESPTPDQDSFCFTTAVSPSSSYIYVHWREVWAPSGAIYWHTSLLGQYSFEPGLDALTEDFQKHVSNILDYELLERMPKVWQQAQQLLKRKLKDGDSELPEAKTSRVN